MIKMISKGKAKLIVEVGKGDARHRKTKTVTYKTKAELKKMYDEFERECKRDPLSDVTVSELLESYIENRKAMGVKETTLKGYRTSQKALTAFCGDFLASEVSPYLLEEFVSKRANSDHASPKTLRNNIGLLSAAYDRAIRMEQLEKNPCKCISLPKDDRKDILTFSEAEVSVFLEALEDERLDYQVGFKLALFCGMRRSEILGLRECDIGNGCVRIRQTRHRVDREDIVQTPKTKRSQRVLALPDTVAEDIERLMAKHHALKFEHSDYLVQDGYGQPMNPSALSARVYDITARCGLPPVSVHGLRHTFATMLNSEQIDIARISAELGHSNITTTLNVYTHVFGSVSASSKGIAKAMEKRIVTAGTFTAPEAHKKTAEA